MNRLFSAKSQVQFLNPLKNPFESAKSFLSYRQRWIPFWANLIFGSATLTIAVIVAILELVSLVQSGFKLGGFGTTLAPKFPGDSQSYGLFALEITLFAQGAISLVAAFVGRAILYDALIQWIYALLHALLWILGFAGSIIVMIISCGRLNSCLGKDKGTPFCHDEKGDLIAVIVLTVMLVITSFVLLLVAAAGLFIRSIQLMAIGMPKVERARVLSLSDAASQKVEIDKWLGRKSAEEMTEAAKDATPLFSTSQLSSAASSGVAPSTAHRAVAAHVGGAVFRRQ